jgi:hypothetical protein
VDIIKTKRAASDKAVRQIRRDFLVRIQQSKDQTNWQDVEARIVNGEVAVYNSIQWGKWHAAKEIFRTYISMYNVCLRFLQKMALKKDEFGIVIDDESFKMPNPRAEQWLMTFAAEEIKSITNTDKLLIREVLATGQRTGRTIRDTTKELEKVIGLTPSQYKAYNKYVSNINRTGMKDSQKEKLADKYYNKLLKNRAETIALTESEVAVSQAWQDSLREMVRQGVVTDKEFELVWWTAPDERRCEICGGLHNTTQPPSKPNWPHGEPPVHPRCRCNTFIRSK